jgi:hypothetical protein
VLSRFQALTKSEIAHFDLSIAEEDILWFDIAVHDIEAVEDLKGLQQLPEDAQRLLLGEGALPAKRLEESAAIAVLIDEVVVVARLEMILVLDDVFAGADRRESFDLVDGAFLQLIILLKLFDRDYFHGEFSHFLVVYGSVDFAVVALAYLLQKGVVIDHLDHHFCRS